MSTQRFAVGLALALLIPACGGGSSSSTPVTTTTTTVPCVQTVVRNDTGTIPASTFASITFTFNATARLDVIADWTNASSPIGVYVTSGSCTLDQFNARTCNFVIRSEPSTVKPRKLSAPNVAPGSYALSLGNFAAQDESVATQVISSSASCAPIASAPVSAQGSAPSVSRMIRR
jgi:hypothetical protein